MTKQHFKKFAEAIQNLDTKADCVKMAQFTASIFTELNTRFDISTYYNACNVTKESA